MPIEIILTECAIINSTEWIMKEITIRVDNSNVFMQC